MQSIKKLLKLFPIGPLGLIALPSSNTLGSKVNDYLVSWRDLRESEHKETTTLWLPERHLQIKCLLPRFGTGEAKGQIKESVRGYDLYLLVDVIVQFNLTVCGHKTTCHQMIISGLKRIVLAVVRQEELL